MQGRGTKVVEGGVKGGAAMSGWNYVVTAHKPTNVTHSCVGYFTNPQELNLIIAYPPPPNSLPVLVFERLRALFSVCSISLSSENAECLNTSTYFGEWLNLDCIFRSRVWTYVR